MKLLLVSPVIIPLLTAVVSLLFMRRTQYQRILGIVGSGMTLVAAVRLLTEISNRGVQVLYIGDWPAPFGITFVADLFSAIMVVLSSLTGFMVLIYAAWALDSSYQARGFYPLYQFMLVGVSGAFLTGDLFNLYVWFEVLLISSFVLMVLGGKREQMEGSAKYVTINLVSSVLFLAGTGIVYGKTGTLNMADIAQKLAGEPASALLGSTAALFLIAFGIKAAVFPLFFWLPASYHTPPAAVSAIFAGLLTKVGVYAIVRSFSLFFVQDQDFFHPLLLVLAGFTMVVGVLGAASQGDIRKILSFHIVSQIGYMIMGFAFATPLALAGTIFYIIHHIIVKTNLFLVSGVIRTLRGTEKLSDIGGLYGQHPLLAVAFVIPAFALAGIPPLSGFFAKFTLIRAGLEVREYLIVGISLFVGIMTLFSMTKVWSEAFWKSDPRDRTTGNGTDSRRIHPALFTPILVLSILTLLIGLFAEPVFRLATDAAHQLFDSTEYITAVLGKGRP